jgi:transcriptional regulator with XRE-family HTH domain
MLNIADFLNHTELLPLRETQQNVGRRNDLTLPAVTFVTATSEETYPAPDTSQGHIRDTFPFEVVARLTGAELIECSRNFLSIALNSFSNSIQAKYLTISLLPVEPTQSRSLPQSNPEGQSDRYTSPLQAKRLRELSGLTIEQVANIFGVSRITFHKWMEGSQLSDRHREHLLEVLPLVEEALRRIGTPNTLSAWLLTPVSPGGKKPIDYLSSRQYNTFRGFLLRQGADHNLLRPPAPLGITYRERPREEIEDELARLHPGILLDEDYPDTSDNDE